MDLKDLAKLSDEELDSIVDRGGAPAKKEPKRDDMGQVVMPPNKGLTAKDFGLEGGTPLGMGRGETFLAGMGQPVNELVEGVKNKAALAATPAGKQYEDMIARIKAEREERRALDAPLLASPWGSAGRMTGEMLPYAAGPARIGAQTALAGGLEFLKDSPGAPSGVGNDLWNSAIRGGEGAASTWLVGKGLQGLGKTIGAAKHSATPAGEEALIVDRAARRIGMPELSIGQLEPNSIAGQIERNLATYPKRVQAQGEALRNAADDIVQVPKAKGRGTEPKTVPGGALREDLKAAVAERYNQARSKYAAVDEFALKEGLGNLQPSYTYSTMQTVAKKLTPVGEHADKNPVFQLLDYYDDKAFDWLKYGAQKATPREVVKQGVPMSGYHDMRVAVNKALGATERQLKPGVPQELRDTHKALKDLKTALDNDAARWAKSAEGNEEAMKLYKEANDFWSKVVAPDVLENKLARKAASKMRGYEDAKSMYSDIINNPELVSRLHGSMPKRSQDIVGVMQRVPELGRYLQSGALPEPSSRGALGALASAVTQHPLRAAGTMLTHAPGVSTLARSPGAKRLYYAQDVLSGRAPGEAGVARLLPPQGALPRAAWATAQAPAESIREWEQKLLGRPTRRPAADR